MTIPAENPVLDRTLDRRRRSALRRFMVRRLATGWASRVAFALAIAIALGFAAWMLALFWTVSTDLAHVLAIRGVRWICMVAGALVTLGVAKDFEARDATEGVNALLGQRGYTGATVQRAYVFATVRLIAGTLLVPAAGLSVLTVVLSRSADAVLGRLLLGVGVVGFVVLLSTVLGLCARGAVLLDHRRSRWILVALLVGPDLAAAFGVNVPGIPSLFLALLNQVAALGVAFG